MIVNVIALAISSYLRFITSLFQRSQDFARDANFVNFLLQYKIDRDEKHLESDHHYGTETQPCAFSQKCAIRH